MPSKYAQQFQPAFDMSEGKYGVGIAWDAMIGEEVDIDLQCVIVDKRGAIVDAVYYNNLLAMGGVIGHTGDEKTGDKSLFDEIIWMKLNKLPTDVQMMIFVVAAYAGGRLDNARGTNVVLLHQNAFNPVQQIRIPKTGCDVTVACVVERSARAPGGWQFQAVNDSYCHGSHFLDILEPNLGDIIRTKITGAPRQQTVSFEMEKGCVMDFAGDLKRIIVGIGAELMVGQDRRATYKACQALKVDIDISAVCYTSQGKRLATVDGNTSSTGVFGITHSGDSIGGLNASQMLQIDDEAIQINLASVPPTVDQIFLLFTVANGTFENVQGCYARVCDQACNQLVRYAVSGGRKESGLIVGRLLREPGKRWGFQAVGKFYDRTKMQKVIKNRFFTTAPDTSQAPRTNHKMTTAATAAPVGKDEKGLPTGCSPECSLASLDGFCASAVAAPGRTGDHDDGTSDSSSDVAKHEGECVHTHEICEVGELSDLPKPRLSAKVERLLLLQNAVDDVSDECAPEAHAVDGINAQRNTPCQVLRTMRRVNTVSSISSSRPTKGPRAKRADENGMPQQRDPSKFYTTGSMTVTRSKIRKGTLSLEEVEEQAALRTRLSLTVGRVARNDAQLALPVLLGGEHRVSEVVYEEQADAKQNEKDDNHTKCAYCSVSSILTAGWMDMFRSRAQ